MTLIDFCLIKTKKHLVIYSIVVFYCLAFCSRVYALRPFVSTDAAVADKGKWEIELGLFDITNKDGQNEFSSPSLRFNYGFLKDWEIVAETDVQVYKEGEGRNSALKDSGLFVKNVIKEGKLQGKAGLSLASEFGVLLPSTEEGKRNAGLEGAFIISGEFKNIGYHLNTGMEFDREDFDQNGLWGVIFEYPFSSPLRLVAEINGRFKQDSLPENSGLVGLLWDTGKMTFDVGARMGLSNAAADWGLTVGTTFSF